MFDATRTQSCSPQPAFLADELLTSKPLMRAMDGEEVKPSLPLQFSAALIAVLVTGIGLLLWFKLKLWSMELWSELSLSFMPLVLGAVAGLAVRLCSRHGTFGLAGFVAGITVVAGMAGGAMQHRMAVEHRLHLLAAGVYDETLAHARAIGNCRDEKALWRTLTNSEVAVIGRLAHIPCPATHEQYWRIRNLYHFHWLASRQIVIYGQGGVDRTIYEATRVREGGPFMHQIVTAAAKEPITEEDITRFHEWEEPFLEKLASNLIKREKFESELMAMGHRALSWEEVAFHGMGPLLGVFTACGALVAFKLVRQETEGELI